MTMATTMTKVTTTTIKTTKTTTAAMMTTSMTLCISYSVTEYNYCLSPALSNSNSAANDTKRTHNSRRLKLQTLFISVQRQRTGGEDEQKSELRAHQVLFVVNRGILHCRHLDKSTGHPRKNFVFSIFRRKMFPPPLPNHHDHPSSDHVFQTFLLPSHNQRIHGRCMYRACTKTSVRPPATELQAGVYIHGAAPGFHAAPFAAPATHDCQWPSAECAHQTPPQRPHSLPA